MMNSTWYDDDDGSICLDLHQVCDAFDGSMVLGMTTVQLLLDVDCCFAAFSDESFIFFLSLMLPGEMAMAPSSSSSSWWYSPRSVHLVLVLCHHLHLVVQSMLIISLASKHCRSSTSVTTGLTIVLYCIVLYWSFVLVVCSLSLSLFLYSLLGWYLLVGLAS